MTVTLPECAIFEGATPHPVPLGEGTPEYPLRVIRGSLLHPHPLADADTSRCKPAKASLRGEGQDEGGFPPCNPQPNDHLNAASREVP